MNISESLGALNVQQSRMRTALEPLDDVKSLRLLRDASSYSQQDLSNVASGRLLSLETTSIQDQATTSMDTYSYYITSGVWLHINMLWPCRIRAI